LTKAVSGIGMFFQLRIWIDVYTHCRQHTSFAVEGQNIMLEGIIIKLISVQFIYCRAWVSMITIYTEAQENNKEKYKNNNKNRSKSGT
jgi:hypothetical protein